MTSRVTLLPRFTVFLAAGFWLTTVPGTPSCWTIFVFTLKSPAFSRIAVAASTF
jgi:hypothetical protein